MNRVAERLAAIPPEPIVKREPNRYEIEVARRARLEAFQATIGPRYRYKTLDNYEIYHDNQRALMKHLRAYLAKMPEEVAAGNGIVLHGPTGTGKDHLLIAVAREAILQHGLDVLWQNGLDVFGQFRDAIDARRHNESALIKRLADPTILILSEPVAPGGILSEYEVKTLLRILDRRYHACRPTWVSANVADGNEAAERLSPQIAGRLRDGAITCRCDWPSYRRGRTVAATP